jgi:hypothetical protein
LLTKSEDDTIPIEQVLFLTIQAPSDRLDLVYRLFEEPIESDVIAP